MIKILFFYSLFFINNSFAEFQYLDRSPVGLLMGDAFTAIADDEYSLFYNPAALGRNGGFSLTPLNPKITVTNALDEMDRFKDFPTDDVSAISDRLLGLPLHLDIGINPNVKMAGFGFNIIYRSRTNISLENAIHPVLDIDYRYDRGFVTGYAHSFGSGKRSKTGVKTSIGVSIKHIEREALQGRFDLFGTELLNLIDAGSSDIYAIRRSLGFSKGKAWGGDFGLEHSISRGVSKLTFGASVLDIGDTQFRKTEGTKRIPRQEMSVNLGSSWNQDFKFIDYTLAIDLHPLNQQMDFANKLHFGAKVSIPFVSVIGGINGGYVSYGVELDIFIIKILAGFYSVNLGNDFKQTEGKRALIYLSLFDFSFDA